MSITVNGLSCVPPGFRFHPTEEELLNYYLTKKVASEKMDMDVIRDVDLNKLEPWDIQEMCRIGSTPQNDWYFFSHKDKKYPTGTRTNRATAAGFWKATGRDKVIHTSFKRIGMRKTLVFYRGRAPHGQKSDWIMHEYRLDDQLDANSHSNASISIEEMAAQEDGWVICRVFKKNHNKALDSTNNCSSINSDAKAQMTHSSSDGAMDQILQYIGRSCKQETEVKSRMSISNNPKDWSSNSNTRYLLQPIDTIFCNDHHERFMKLPALGRTPLPSLPIELAPTHDRTSNEQAYIDGTNMDTSGIASQFSDQSEVSKQLAYFDNPVFPLSSFNWLLAGSQDYHQLSGDGDGDLWSFTS